MFHPLSIDALRQDRESGALRNCTCTVKSGQSGPRALPSRWDLCSTPRILTMPCTSLMSCNTELSFWTLLSDSDFPSLGCFHSKIEVSLAFDIERGCLAGQRLDKDLHATTQCVLPGFGGDGLRRLHEGLRSCLRVSPTPSASCVRNTFRLLARLLVIPSPPCSTC